MWRVKNKYNTYNLDMNGDSLPSGRYKKINFKINGGKKICCHGPASARSGSTTEVAQPGRASPIGPGDE